LLSLSLIIFDMLSDVNPHYLTWPDKTTSPCPLHWSGLSACFGSVQFQQETHAVTCFHVVYTLWSDL